MTTARSVLPVVLAFLAVTTPARAHEPDSDPQILLDKAREALDGGDTAVAGRRLAALESLLQSDPAWDPDGSYATTLIPRLAGRLARLEAASAALTDLRGDLAGREQPGAGSLDESLHWGTGMAREVMDGTAAIAGELPPGPERGALLQSAAYLQTQGILQDRVLPYLDATVPEQAGGYAADAEQVDIMKKRLQSLKQDLMTQTQKGERLQGDLAHARNAESAYVRGLVKMMGADTRANEAKSFTDLEQTLGERLRQRIIQVRELQGQTVSRKAFHMAELEIFRFINGTIVAAGGTTQKGRIDLLARTVEAVPVQAGDAPADQAGWFGKLLTGSGK